MVTLFYQTYFSLLLPSCLVINIFHYSKYFLFVVVGLHNFFNSKQISNTQCIHSAKLFVNVLKSVIVGLYILLYKC